MVVMYHRKAAVARLLLACPNAAEFFSHLLNVKAISSVKSPTIRHLADAVEPSKTHNQTTLKLRSGQIERSLR